MPSDSLRYGAQLGPARQHADVVAIDSAADLLAQTVNVLVRRTPSIAAAAACELGSIVLTLHFGDGSEAVLAAHLNTLVVTHTPADATVACFFDDKSLIALYDVELRPSEVIAQGAFDVRGPSDQVLAVWRTFQLLAQRAAGLRPVQSLWRAYRRSRKIDVGVAQNGRAHEPGPRERGTGCRRAGP